MGVVHCGGKASMVGALANNAGWRPGRRTHNLGGGALGVGSFVCRREWMRERHGRRLFVLHMKERRRWDEGDGDKGSTGRSIDCQVQKYLSLCLWFGRSVDLLTGND